MTLDSGVWLWLLDSRRGRRRGRPPACPVRVFSPQHEDGGHGACHDGHEQVVDAVAHEEAEEGHEHIGVREHGQSRAVGVVDDLHADVGGHRADDDVAQPEHVAREVVVHDGAPALGGEQLEHVATCRHEAVAVATDVREGEAVEELDPAFDAGNDAGQARKQTRQAAVAASTGQPRENVQNPHDSLQNGHDERAEADTAEVERHSTQPRSHGDERRVCSVLPGGNCARRGDANDVAQHERNPEVDEQHAAKHADDGAGLVLELTALRRARALLLDVVLVEHDAETAEHPEHGPADLHADHDQCHQQRHGQSENGFAGHLEVRRRELDPLADAAHVQGGEQRDESEDHGRPPVPVRAAVVRLFGEQDGGGDVERDDGEQGHPDEHLGQQHHDGDPDDRHGGSREPRQPHDAQHELHARRVGQVLHLRGIDELVAVFGGEHDGDHHDGQERDEEEEVVALALHGRRIGLSRRCRRLQHRRRRLGGSGRLVPVRTRPEDWGRHRSGRRSGDAMAKEPNRE
ncbi:unnamed protein product [Phytophthora lilii]|uniref:Unnamed protein product n=1 Tax=Phytophthora lilii TaxID=2077276 RepID=A0A9W6TSX7_9STRA|nr:unnamed protein product [Phytophthora lilii]